MMNFLTEGCDGSSCLWYGRDEALFLSTYFKKYFCSKTQMQSASLPEGCSWGVGYGIIRTPRAVVPTPHSPKDVCHVAPPARHRASARRNGPCGPHGLSQRPSLSHVP